MERINKKLCLTVMAVFILISASFVFADEPVQPLENCVTPFSVSEVIEHVTHHPIMEGNTIVIRDRVYETSFNEHGVVLKARETKQDAEDLIIPVTGRPEIQDGKVVYQTEYGEITFVGTSRGIRFEQRNQSPVTIPPITDYSGNVARLENEKITEWSREGEFLIDTTFVSVPAPGDQWSPSVAFDGTNYLVVWEDAREDTITYCLNIYGTRVDQSGNVLDPSGIAMSTAAGSRGSPSVAFDGTNYLVVWADGRSASSYDIYGARLDQSGTVLDPEGIAITTELKTQGSPSVAFDGINYLVVWHDLRSDTADIYGARLDQAGTVLDSSGIAISTAANWQYSPSVAFDGTNYLVVWYDWRSDTADIYGARVDQAGIVLDPSGIAVSTAVNEQESPSVAFDGANYFVVWQDYRNGVYDIYGTRVDQSGTVLDPSGIAVSTEANDQKYPSVAFSDTNYFVVWQDYRSGGGIYGARVDQSGGVLDPSGIIIAGYCYQTDPSIAFDGTNYLVVWEDMRNYYFSYEDIYGARVNQSGVVLDSSGIAISIVANEQLSASIAFDGTNYLVVWQNECISTVYDIYGARVNQSGVVLEPSPIAISTAAGNQGGSSVAFDGTNYLVVWQDYRNGDYDIYGARVDQAGTVLDTDGIAISTAAGNQGSPSVGFDGTNYLVVYSGGGIYGARVDQSGVVLDPTGIAITTFASFSPSIAFDGTNYLVVWEDWRNYDPPWHFEDIYGARVTQSGTVLDPTGIAITTSGGPSLSPSVAFDGTNYLVVWTQNVWGIFHIYGRRVDQSGVVLDPTGIAITTFASFSPSVAFDGTNYLIVWKDWRSGTEWDIYGAKLNTSGVVLNTYVVSLQPGDQITPALVHGAGDQILIAYSGWADSINGQTVNAMRIWGKFYPFVGIEENTLHSAPYAIRLQVFPNPVMKQCNIKYTLPQNMNVRMSMFDATGRLVKEIIYARQNAGKYQKTVDMSNLAQSVYFIRLETDKHSQTEKVIYLK